MAFTEAERIAIRRYCGYPLFGNTPNPQFGYRFFQAYGTLEYRMTNLSDEELAVVRDNFLPKLAELETDIYGVRDNSDTSQAAVWYRNKDELLERKRNYNYWRTELCNFFGVPSGPGLNGGGVRFAV